MTFSWGSPSQMKKMATDVNALTFESRGICRLPSSLLPPPQLLLALAGAEVVEALPASRDRDANAQFSLLLCAVLVDVRSTCASISGAGCKLRASHTHTHVQGRGASASEARLVHGCG